MRNGLFILAIAMLLAGATLLFVGSANFGLRSSGVLLCIMSAYLIRVSKLRGASGKASSSSDGVNLEERNGPGRLAWALGIGSAVAAGISFILLYEDALGGYHNVWPVRIFAFFAMIFILVWSYLGAKLM